MILSQFNKFKFHICYIKVKETKKEKISLYLFMYIVETCIKVKLLFFSK